MVRYLVRASTTMPSVVTHRRHRFQCWFTRSTDRSTGQHGGANLDPKLKTTFTALEEEEKKVERTARERHLASRIPGSFSAVEYMDRSSTDRSTATRRLSVLVASGRVKRIRIPQLDVNGFCIFRPGYVLTEEK